jgi:hypothetical protein
MTSRFHTVLLCPTSTHPVWMRAQCRREDIVQGRPYWKSAPGRSTIGRDDRRRSTSCASGGSMREPDAQRGRRTRRAVTAITTLGVAAVVILLCRGCGGPSTEAQESETDAFVEAANADALTGPAGPTGHRSDLHVLRPLRRGCHGNSGMALQRRRRNTDLRPLAVAHGRHLSLQSPQTRRALDTSRELVTVWSRPSGDEDRALGRRIMPEVSKH